MCGESRMHSVKMGYNCILYQRFTYLYISSLYKILLQAQSEFIR